LRAAAKRLRKEYALAFYMRVDDKGDCEDIKNSQICERIHRENINNFSVENPLQLFFLSRARNIPHTL